MLAIPKKVKEVLLKNGFFDLSIGQYQEALDEFNALLEIVPDHVEAMYGAGCCLVALEQKEEAKKMLSKTLELKPAYQAAKKLMMCLNQ